MHEVQQQRSQGYQRVTSVLQLPAYRNGPDKSPVKARLGRWESDVEKDVTPSRAVIRILSKFEGIQKYLVHGLQWKLGRLSNSVAHSDSSGKSLNSTKLPPGYRWMLTPRGWSSTISALRSHNSREDAKATTPVPWTQWPDLNTINVVSRIHREVHSSGHIISSSDSSSLPGRFVSNNLRGDYR